MSGSPFDPNSPKTTMSWDWIAEKLAMPAGAYAAHGVRKLSAREGTPVMRHDPDTHSATLNGKPFTRSWITHAEIAADGKLILNMGSSPNRS